MHFSTRCSESYLLKRRVRLRGGGCDFVPSVEDRLDVGEGEGVELHCTEPGENWPIIEVGDDEWQETGLHGNGKVRVDSLLPAPEIPDDHPSAKRPKAAHL